MMFISIFVPFLPYPLLVFFLVLVVGPILSRKFKIIVMLISFITALPFWIQFCAIQMPAYLEMTYAFGSGLLPYRFGELTTTTYATLYASGLIAVGLFTLLNVSIERRIANRVRTKLEARIVELRT